MRTPGIKRSEALDLLKTYNKETFHIRHALTVEAVMGEFASSHAPEEQEYWSMVGLLHDIDYEEWPEEHCQKAPELLREGGVSEDMIRSIVSHAYGICSDVEPEHLMENLLFAGDELTGLIGGAALVRPSKSVADMEPSCLKKQFKDKRFAAGCDRTVIAKGALRLAWSLDELLQETLNAMKAAESRIEAEVSLHA